MLTLSFTWSAVRGILDNLPWLCCLFHRVPTRRGMLQTVLILGTVISIRVWSVVGQPSLDDYIFSFAPTEWAMYVNVSFAALYVLLLLLSSDGVRGTAVYVRPQCRLWLFFLSTCYLTSTLGYFLFLMCGIEPTTAMWIGEAGLFLYAVFFGPALYGSFLLERRYWTKGTHSWAGVPGLTPTHAERLLEAVVNTSSSPSHSPAAGSHRPSKKQGKLPMPALTGPPGAPLCGGDPQSAQMLRAALEGVTVIPYAELRLHEIVGTGGFAEVFRASWPGRAIAAQPPSPRMPPPATSATSSTAVSPSPLAAPQAAPRPAHVAVKQLRTLPRERKALESFCKEIALMQRLQHPHVLSLVGVTIAPTGLLSVITEFMPRGSVFQMLHPTPTPAGQLTVGTPLPRGLAMRMMGDCAHGMNYLHSLSPPIIHRDLKSQNLLVAPDFSVKVADFGLSRECLQTAAMTRVGSVQWAAPEVLLGQSYSHKCDMWSFGVVCWEVLTARVPFDGMSQAAVATQVAMEGMRLPVPPGVSIRLLRLIARCWSEQPEQRPEFSTLAIELQAVEREISEAGSSDSAPQPQPPRPPPPRPPPAQ